MACKYKNLSLVTGADGIFPPHGGLFAQYRESQKYPSTLVTSGSFFSFHF